MNEQPMNLRPYGGMTPDTGHLGEGSMEERALQRARQKLQHIRSGASRDSMAGIDKRRFIFALVVALLIGTPFLLGTIALLSDDKSRGAAVVPAVFALCCFAIPTIYYFTTRPDSPKRLLKQYYTMLGRGRHARAKQLVTNADYDNFPRLQPFIQNLGTPSGHTHRFDVGGEYERYWNDLLRANPSPYCYTRVNHVRETHVGPDVIIVDFQVRFTMNTSLYMLLILVALLIAVIVDLATRKVVTVQMRKVLVKIDDEWKMFEGEWQGYAEYDTSWLHGRP